MVSVLVIPFLVAAVLVFVVAGIKQVPEKGGQEMMKSVYIYLVLFATLMMTIGGSVAGFMALADIIAPVPYHQSYEDFRRWGYPGDKEQIEGEKLTEEELQVRYEALVKAEKERQINRAKNNLVKSLGWIVIPLPVFITFQRRLANRETEIS
ncbi:MAG: hypothetical protein ACOYVD_15935 [Bacillota bacterium]